MKTKNTLALLSAAAISVVATTATIARAEPPPPAGDVSAAPPFTLEVDTDAPDVISYESLAARIASDLGAAVARPSGVLPSRASIVVRYRDRELSVRATYPGGRVIERTVKPEGDDAAVQREAVALAGNVAKGEAREPRPDGDRFPVTLAFLHPLATNANRPNVTSNADFSLLYGRVGTIEGLQLGSLAVNASRGVEGAQIAGVAAVTGGPVNGLQLSGAVNVATGDVSGAQVAPVNVAGPTDGVQLGVVNVGKRVRGLQLGIVNVAEDVDGAAIGLVSISRNSVHPIVWTSNLQYLNAGVKFSTKYVFTVIAAHIGTHEADFDNVGGTFAIGGHIPLPASFDLELQTSFTQLAPWPKRGTGENTWVAHHAVAGYSFAPHLRAFVGGGVRMPISVEVGRDVSRPEVLAGFQF